MRRTARLLGLLVLLPVAAFLGVNVFLNTALPVLLNQRPDLTRITYDSAWLDLRGQLEVRNLRVEARSPTDVVTLALDRASGTVDVARLADHTFRATGVRAHGASFTYTLAEGPPLDPAVRIWRVELDDAAVDGVREVHVEGHHYVGDARASAARFAFEADRHVAVADARLDVLRGDVLAGETPMLADLHGTVTLGLEPLDPAAHPDRGVLRHLSGRATLDGDVRSLAFLGFYLRGAPWLSVGGGAGTVHVDATVAHGVVQPGSVLRTDLRDIAARFLSFRITGDGVLRLEVDDKPETQLTVDFDDYAIARDGDAAPHVRGRGFHVTARTEDVALDAPFTALDVVLDLPRSDIPDVSVYNAYLPRGIGLALREGRGSVRGRLQVRTPDNVGRGELWLTGKGVTATLDALTITGDVALHAVVPEGRLDDGRYTLGGTRLELTEVSVTEAHARPRDRSTGWWATLDLPRGHAQSGGAVYLDAELAVKLRDTLPFLAVFSQKQKLPGWARSLLAIRDVSGQARLRLGEEVLHLPAFEVRGAKGFELSLQLRRKQLHYFGKLHARYGLASLGMQLLGAQSRVQLLGARRWYDGLPAVD